MATGSGKTLVSDSVLNRIFEIRERFYKRFPHKERLPFQVTILSHRIDALDQLHDDLLIWRNGHAPLLVDTFRSRVHSRIYHSQTSGDEIWTIWGKSPDLSIVFSTFQTSNTKDGAHVKNSDLVIVDDAHVLSPGNEYFKWFERALTKNPTVLANTATPNNYTFEIFGKPAFNYPLGRYLASPYSPSLEYHFLTQQGVSEEKIQKLNEEMNMLAKVKDMDKRKREYEALHRKFDKILSKFPNISILVDDLLKRLQIGKDWEIDKTLIFCPNIKIADEVAEDINTTLGQKGIALSYHSKNDRNDGLETFSSEESTCKILVVVDKMNEWVDIPDLKNIVLWRWTDSMSIFLQQFGRWLRGKKHIRYFDYVGGLMNFIGIHGIYSEYQRYSSVTSTDPEEPKDKNDQKFRLIWGYTGTMDTSINMSTIGLRLAKHKNYTDIPPVVSKEELQRMFRENEILPHHISSSKDWLLFSKGWNGEYAIERGYHLPRMIEWIYGMFDITDPYYERPQFLPNLLLDKDLPEKIIYSEWKRLDNPKTILSNLINSNIIPIEVLFTQEAWSNWFKSYPRKVWNMRPEIGDPNYVLEITRDWWNKMSAFYIGDLEIYKELERLFVGSARFSYDDNVHVHEESVRAYLAENDTSHLAKESIKKEEFWNLYRTDKDFVDIIRWAYHPYDVKRWNRTTGWKIWVRLPTSRKTLINILWWKWSKKNDLLNILDWLSYNPIPNKIRYREMNEHDLYILFRDWKITEHQLRLMYNNELQMKKWCKDNRAFLWVRLVSMPDKLVFQDFLTRQQRENIDFRSTIRADLNSIRMANLISVLKTKPEEYFKIIHASPEDDTPA